MGELICTGFVGTSLGALSVSYLLSQMNFIGWQIKFGVLMLLGIMLTVCYIVSLLFLSKTYDDATMKKAIMFSFVPIVLFASAIITLFLWIYR